MTEGADGLPAFMLALKARVGGLVLYVKEKHVENKSCEVDILRCIVREIDTKTLTSPSGETTSYAVLLIPDVPLFRDPPAKSETAPRSLQSAVENARIVIDGPTAQRCLFFDYKGLEDVILRRLGPIDGSRKDKIDTRNPIY
jgi:hypothetical protein